MKYTHSKECTPQFIWPTRPKRPIKWDILDKKSITCLLSMLSKNISELKMSYYLYQITAYEAARNCAQPKNNLPVVEKVDQKFFL